jgi:hypothetical protein
MAVAKEVTQASFAGNRKNELERLRSGAQIKF